MSMKRLVVAAVAAVLTLAAASVAAGVNTATSTLQASLTSQSTPPVRTCATLMLVTFDDGSRVTSAQDVSANGSTPAHCEVRVLVLDRINIIVELPDTNWNGRYQAVGNGVYAGSSQPPTAGLADGYVTSSTDTGHQDSPFSGAWAWSPTGMNYPQIHDFAFRANHEMAVKSKALIQYDYGQAATYSYWNGCSTGGREGITEAVRYPNDFDGILAKSPAINWTRFIPAEEWPAVVMNQLHDFLPSCKAQALPALVQKACDLSDGVKDGLWDARDCKFDASSVIGIQTSCGAFTATDAAVIQKVWDGPRRVNGGFLWYGLTPGSDFGSAPGLGLATTVSANGAGPNPPDLFSLVVKWRETAVAPATLTATLPPGSGVNTSSQPMTRPVCLYPGRVRYKGSGSIYDASSFKCVNGPTGTGNS
jgi:Tannase and feruloyl esterase